MSTFVLELDEKNSLDLIKQLQPYKINSKNPYIRFAAKIEGVNLSLYSSGKLVLQGRDPDSLASQLGLAKQAPQSQAKPDSNLNLIGSDEVGNGSYFGGLAVVASFVSQADQDFLRKLGVDDSKNLNDRKIRQLAPLLMERIPHKALLLSPQKYNQVVGADKAHNAVSVKVALHNQAIYLLLKTGVQPEQIIIDAFTSQSNYQKYLQHENNRFSNPLTLVQKAESQYLAVAVSSIIARNLFLENLEDLGQDLGFDLPSGAGQASDRVASQILQAYGPEALAKVAKWHFKNTQKAFKLAQNKE